MIGKKFSKHTAFFAPVMLVLLQFTPSSPAQASSESVYRVYGVDAVIISAAWAAALAPDYHADKLVKPSCPCDPETVNRFDRGVIGNHSLVANKWSDAKLLASVAAPIALNAIDVGIGNVFFEDLAIYAETLAVSGFLVNAVKYTFQRPRPLVYTEHGLDLARSPGGYLSFYSGHASLTFAALSAASVTANLRHEAGVLPWVITVVVGSSVAAERVLAGKHYYSDVIVGGLAGVAVGTLVPMLHAKDSARGPIAKNRPVMFHWGASFQ